MARANVPIFAFNRGLISDLALARTDIPRTALSASVFFNWMPRVLGSMMLRPGLGYITSTRNDLLSYNVPFVFKKDDSAAIQFTDQNMRVLVDDVPITRDFVSTAVTSGDFSSDSGWVDIDEVGSTSTISGNQLELVGTDFATAGRKQSLTISGTDSTVEHALRINVERGPVTFRLGTTDGGDDLISETTLGTGEHSLSFIPNSVEVFLQFTGLSPAKKIVTSCEIESSGIMDITAPWLEADMRLIRYDQSADVIYLACEGYQTQKIERRSVNSWSLVNYEPDDGPFRSINTGTIQLTPSAISGDITLTASRALFRTTHVGALFKITSIGQVVEADVTGENQWTDPIRIQGVGSSQRSFEILRAGAWVGTITLQRSVGEIGSWVDVSSYTANGSNDYNDGLDNQIIFYRLGINAGDYTSGTAELSMTYANGNVVGICRVTDYNSETVVEAAVLKSLGGTAASFDWQEGIWSDRRGHPSATVLSDGRLEFAGNGRFLGSISDAFESFDEDVIGDSAALNRTIGKGPVSTPNWMLDLSRVIVGTDAAEWNMRSSSLDEPLTNGNYSAKAPSTEGSAAVMAASSNDEGYFVHSNGTKLYKLSDGGDVAYGKFVASDLTEIRPDVGEPSLVRVQVQKQPDKRIHCVRGDGKAVVLIIQSIENVLCWVEVETDGFIEAVMVLPGTIEDQVYYQVRRVIDGVTRRYWEKWAMESECQGGMISKLADSHILYDGTAVTTVTGLSHLEGKDVVVWADGIDVGTHTVSGGSITLAVAASKVVVGLSYDADFQSTKLAYAAQGGSALTVRKKLDHLGLILKNTHAQGIQYGRDFENLDGLPLHHEGALIDQNTIHSSYDTDPTEFNGNWDTDSRLCLRASAPRPCTVLAAVIGINTNG